MLQSPSRPGYARSGLCRYGVVYSIVRQMVLLQAGDIVTAMNIFKQWSEASKKGGPQAQRRWCEDANINGRLLSTAKAAKRTILEGLQAIGIPADTSNEQSHQPEDISKMFAAGFFMNLASRHGKEDVFLAAGVNQIAYVPQESAYKAAPSPHWPHWVVYKQLHRSANSTLLQLSPVELEWIAELAPAYYQDKLETFQVCACSQACICT